MRILSPLRERDFALLWCGLTVSLLGDGIYLVAVAWQVYDLSNTPAALALVGLAWSVGLGLFLLTGGVVSDRFDRRRVMIAADLVRAAALGVIAALSLSGSLEIWHLVLLVGLYGAGEAFFGPALGALVPDLLSGERLTQANALEQFMRQSCRLLLGPALGGIIVAAVGPGDAFVIDAVTFLVSATFIALIRTPSAGTHEAGSTMLAEAKAGLRYAAGQRWLWVTLLTSSLVMLLFFGPMQVLLPYIVRNELDAGATGYGLVLAADGLGAIVAALIVAQRGLPRRYLSVIFGAWALAMLPLIGYALGTTVWQLMLFAAVHGAMITVGLIVFTTLQQLLVPSAVLGRVQSLEWFSSVALVPVSFALTSPVAAALGSHTTLILAGGAAAAVTVGMFLALRLDREERRPLPQADPAAEAAALRGAPAGLLAEPDAGPGGQTVSASASTAGATSRAGRSPTSAGTGTGNPTTS
ncbi:MAG: MFS transporter [Solirubrobacteraceae bacterium]|nr:MFS transporter [Solirubrobacteraceae bacterium]